MKSGLCFSLPRYFSSKSRWCLAAACAMGIAGCGISDSSKKSETSQAFNNLKITELHYHPLDQDTVPGDQYEFVELLNAGSTSLDLSHVGFTDGIDFTFKSGAKLAAGEYLVLAANPVRFKQRYGWEPFGTYTGSMKNSGEQIILSDLTVDTTIASVLYSDVAPWPLQADGGGRSLVPVEPTGATVGAEAWKASFSIHGSPGKADPVVVLINEILTHTDLPAKDAIELFNPNDTPMDIGGWFLSDTPNDPEKFRIPAGTVISAEGYLVFDEDDFNADTNAPTSFRMNSHGDEIYLFADATGCRGFCHGFAYGEMENGVTLGRYITSRGEEHFVVQKSTTLGAPNAGPAVGPLVFSEVMYHPVNDSDEYVELVNTSKDSVKLFDPNFPENTWKIKGFGFTFPVGITLAPGEIVVILSASAPADSFRTAHGIPDSLRLFTAGARLSNGSDTLSLLKPEEPYEDGTGTVVPYQVVEQLGYKDSSPWPAEPDGAGQALVRKELRAYANDPANWKAAMPSPGK
jgi:hypothetical protein